MFINQRVFLLQDWRTNVHKDFIRHCMNNSRLLERGIIRLMMISFVMASREVKMKPIYMSKRTKKEMYFMVT